MTEPPYIPYAYAVPPSRDADHLRVLSILHYVWGGLVLLFSSFAIVYIVLGVLMLTGRFAFATPPGQRPPPPELMGWMMAGMGGCGLALGVAIGIANLVSARKMSRRQGRVFSIVMASINCLSVPLGTTLGVFTLVVLLRDSVRAAYAGAATPRTTEGSSTPLPPTI